MRWRHHVRNRNLSLWAPRLGLFGRLVKIGHMVSTWKREEYVEISGGENPPNIWTETGGNTEATSQIREMCHLKVYPTTRKRRQISGDGTGINGPGFPLKQLWKEWDYLHCRDASSSGTEVLVQSQKQQGSVRTKSKIRLHCSGKIIWKREQQRKKEVEIEDISYCSSTSHFRVSSRGEPIEEGTEFNEDIFPQQTVATELGHPLDCDEVWRATEHVKASAGKDEVLPQSRTANRNARRVCEIHGYHVWMLDQGGTLFRICGGARKGDNKERKITEQSAFWALAPELLPEWLLKEWACGTEKRNRYQNAIGAFKEDVHAGT